MPETPSESFLDHLASQAIELYTLPTVALEVVRLADQRDVDARALRQCIENDPALAGKILKTANSSLFGRGRKVGDLNQAIGILGVKPLKLLALGFSLPKDLIAGHENAVLGEYWRRSLLKAAAAREICRRWWNAEGDDAFVAGLLQDVGALVLLKMLGHVYEQVLAEAYAQGDDPRHRELAAFGFERTAVSVKLLESWGLPANMTDAIAATSEEEGGVIRRPTGDQERLVSALRLAGLFTDVLTGKDKSQLARLLGETARAGNVTWEQIEDLASALQLATRQLTDILSLPKPKDVDYVKVLERAHQQLAGLAAEAAADLASSPRSAKPVAFATSILPARTPCASEPCPTATRSSTRSGNSYANDRVLIDRAAAAVEGCRRGRAPISLALVAIDDFDRVLLARGPHGASSIMRMIERAIDAASESPAGRLQLDERCCAVLLPSCDKSAALGVTRQVSSGLEQWSVAQADGELVTLSVGLATLPAPAKGFPVPELIAAAARCLHTAQQSGGRTCKSIDIF